MGGGSALSFCVSIQTQPHIVLLLRSWAEAPVPRGLASRRGSARQSSATKQFKLLERPCARWLHRRSPWSPTDVKFPVSRWLSHNATSFGDPLRLGQDGKDGCRSLPKPPPHPTTAPCRRLAQRRNIPRRFVSLKGFRGKHRFGLSETLHQLAAPA